MITDNEQKGPTLVLENEVTFYDKEAFLYRLHDGIKRFNKQVVFVVGAPLTAAVGDRRGVSDVSGVVDIIRAEFSDKRTQAEKLETALAAADNRYQTAFDFLSGRAGQDAANQIIRRAVSQALLSTGDSDWAPEICNLSEEQLTALDQDTKIWELSPAVEALGELVSHFPEAFGKLIVTSNFDPLVEVAVERAGGTAWRTSLSADGSFLQSSAAGCHVVHIHGYWHGSDTLHTSTQLLRSRPSLKNDLLSLLQDKVVVVLAYGGWPDIFTGALEGVVSNDNLFPEILWTFFDQDPHISEHLQQTLRPGIARNRVTFYRGIDCHEVLPELLTMWEEEAHATPAADGPQAPSIEVKSSDGLHRPDRGRLFRLAPLECDRPPNIEVWVGRESEIRALETSKAKVVVVCGIGGEGKSALAAHYISTLGGGEPRYRRWDWRDCKEQSDRIRTQICEVIVRFSAGAISPADLSEAGEIELAEVFLDLLSDAHAVVVFDNVDSYVDLENRVFTGLLDTLVQRISSSNSSSRIIVTCRPDVHYSSSSVITFSMKGISEEEAVELFERRAPSQSIPIEDIRAAHRITNGHAFWLDLLAVQVTKVPGTTLPKLIQDMRRGREDVPDVLSSIWDKLAHREKTLLRFMAETARPETEKTIEGFAASQMNYKNFNRALKSLITLNLIVVKSEANAPDLYDLHPLVRQFVRTRFAPPEREDFIRVVIRQYDRIIGTIESMLGIHLPFAMLERWSQKAELQVSAGMYSEAFETLATIEDAFMGGGHVQEYVRVSRLLFESIDWETAPSDYAKFDRIVGVVVGALDQLGEFDSADSLLSQYESTIPQKTARYINFCDIRAFSYWQRGNFDNAIDWASRGVNLKTETNVDTGFDCKHTLALATRDSGNPDEAMSMFLQGRELSELTAPQAADLNGPTYGNVGRCLQMLGRLSEALVCFKRAARILEPDSTSHSKSNRAYARRWIGQVYAELGEPEKAEAFFIDAIKVLGASAPIRVRELYSEAVKARPNGSLVMNDARAARIVSAWMKED